MVPLKKSDIVNAIVFTSREIEREFDRRSDQVKPEVKADNRAAVGVGPFRPETRDLGNSTLSNNKFTVN